MAGWNILILIFAFQMFLTPRGSMVTISNGGFEDIVIAIHPGLQENDMIIQKIQAMVTEATEYVFFATKKRLFIRSVNILIPRTWSAKGNYRKRRRETYERADVIIAESWLKYGDDPYTLQYKGCGEKGKYIHLTPNFLLNSNLTSIYGSLGRVFVHEWAHLRWGVFDEYNTDIPYYISSGFKVEATRCSIDVSGRNIVQHCEGDSCVIKLCDIDPKTGLFEEKCIFLPEKTQTVGQSIMYLQGLPSVSEFCDETNHNVEAPSLQNKMCSFRSTWDVILSSPDIISTSPMDNCDIPPPSFSLTQYKDRVITLLVDVSASMEYHNRIQRLFQAADVFLTQIIEAGSYVGIVEFSDMATVILEPIQLTNEIEREKLLSLIPYTVTHKTSSICPGISAAIEANKIFDGSPNGTEIILVTDGEDHFINCYDEIKNSQVIVHIIALGKEAEKNLDRIADMTGGFKFFATDDPEIYGLIDSFAAISSGNGDVLQRAIQLESTGVSLKPYGCFNGTVVIDKTVGNSTFFLITWQLAVPTIALLDPKRNLYTAPQFTNNTISKSSRLQIPGTAERGPWQYILCNNHTSNQVIGIVVTTKAADENVPPITATAHVNKDMNTYPDPMIVYTSVNQGLSPVTGLKVTATIEPETGDSEILELLDNGTGADIAEDDGVYSKFFSGYTYNGRYSLKVYVENIKNETKLVLPRNLALYVPGYIQNGEIFMNPSRPHINDDDLQLDVGSFRRVVSGGSFVISNVPLTPQPVKSKPGKITDLAANTKGHTIVLSWTATGDDLDQGKASKYDLRMSENPKELRENFTSASTVNITGMAPQTAGSPETFTFVPDGVIMKKFLYFALIAINQDNERSDLSNIAFTEIFSLIQPDPTKVLPTVSSTSTFPVSYTYTSSYVEIATQTTSSTESTVGTSAIITEDTTMSPVDNMTPLSTKPEKTTSPKISTETYSSTPLSRTSTSPTVIQTSSLNYTLSPKAENSATPSDSITPLTGTIPPTNIYSADTDSTTLANGSSIQTSVSSQITTVFTKAHSEYGVPTATSDSTSLLSAVTIKTTTTVHNYTSANTHNTSVTGNVFTPTKITATLAQTHFDQDQVTVVVVIVVCVSAAVILVIICIIVYLAKYKRIIYPMTTV
ncbi:calcium-activated chloride channel regulator 1-like [Spea bombifrons]|uniref:calcium-activated chloride channel regulator 1-like n=1 Tax=Spea bombifrons TaxID=233779 RepID=UPI00234A7432|nr:calcium-activated chloride channel regulator 1-like [Spea bombifrons]